VNTPDYMPCDYVSFKAENGYLILCQILLRSLFSKGDVPGLIKNKLGDKLISGSLRACQLLKPISQHSVMVGNGHGHFLTLSRQLSNILRKYVYKCFILFSRIAKCCCHLTVLITGTGTALPVKYECCAVSTAELSLWHTARSDTPYFVARNLASDKAYLSLWSCFKGQNCNQLYTLFFLHSCSINKYHWDKRYCCSLLRHCTDHLNRLRSDTWYGHLKEHLESHYSPHETHLFGKWLKNEKLDEKSGLPHIMTFKNVFFRIHSKDKMGSR